MNHIVISGLLIFITSLFSAILVFIKGPKKNTSITWGLFSLSVAFWGFGLWRGFITDIESTVLFWSRFLNLSAIFIPLFFFHFVLCFTDRIKDKRKELYFYYVIFSSLFLLAIIFPKTFVPYVGSTLSFKFYPRPGLLYYGFGLVFACLVVYGIILLFKDLKLSTGIRKNQIKYLLLIVFGFAGGATTFFPVFNIKVYPLGTYLVPIYVLTVTYAIVKYRLLDINLALTRVGIFVIVYTLVLGLPFWLGYVTKAWLPATSLAVILATIGPFIYSHLRQQAENLLRKEQLEYQKELRDISSTMMLIKELERLLRTIVLRVVDIVKVSWAGIYLKDEKELKYTLRHQRARMGEINLPGEFSFDSELVKHFYQLKLPLIGEEIHSSELKVGLAVPCFIEDNLLGFLLLGDKPKGQIYDESDVNTFTFLSNQTALAIENCSFYSQERQREHFRRIASLDRQIDCMAHEMDNPIHALLGVLGSIDIALDELKELIPADKMEYLKQKLSRVEFNAKRVSKMISAVKEFTKPTTGEFSPITLEHIINSFEAIINPQLHHYGINFTLNLPQEPIWLRANKVEIEQVLVNLGTNSVQAIREAPKENKKEITLNAYKKDSEILRIDFSDTGSGIEEKLLEDIFLDFVTTKASSEGTGLGLAISRKIIQRHKGKIWAESEGPGKGATFHIDLPIANDVTEEEKRKFEDAQNEDKKRELI